MKKPMQAFKYVINFGKIVSSFPTISRMRPPSTVHWQTIPALNLLGGCHYIPRYASLISRELSISSALPWAFILPSCNM